MTDHRLEELLWTELDGELTEAEAVELGELRDSAPAKTIAADLREFSARLDRIEPEAPPGGLRERILDAIEERSSRSLAKASASFPELARTAPAWVKWGGLAAALVLAVVAYQLAFGPGPQDTSGMAGTISPTPIPDAGPIGPELDTGLDFVRLLPQGDRLSVTLTPGEGTFTFAFRAPGLVVERVDFRDGASGTHESDAQLVTFRILGPGTVEATLGFTSADQSFTFSAFGSGIEPFEGEFVLGQEPQTNFRGADQ